MNGFAALDIHPHRRYVVDIGGKRSCRCRLHINFALFLHSLDFTQNLGVTLGITGYIPAIQFSNSPEKYGFSYLPQEDAFSCPEGIRLVYQRLNCSQTTGKYLRCYQLQGDACKTCKRQPDCFKQTGIRRRILGSSCYPAFYRGHERIGSDTYWHMMRLRKIWAEGSFAVLK